MSEMPNETVLFERDGHMAVITLNRPEVRNAVNSELSAGVEAALDILESERELRVGILTGTGPIFSSGADLKAVAAVIESGEKTTIVTQKGGFGGLVRRQRRKPLIAALNGPALAGGFEIAMACDMIVASDEAYFSLPEVKRCLVANAGALIHLPRLIGLKRAQEMALTGEPITAGQALEWGIVNRLTAPADVMTEAKALAEKVAANAPLAVQATRSVAARAYGMEERDLWHLGFDEGDSVKTSQDAKEGPRAFLEKRPPVWRGE